MYARPGSQVEDFVRQWRYAIPNDSAFGNGALGSVSNMLSVSITADGKLVCVRTLICSRIHVYCNPFFTLRFDLFSLYRRISCVFNVLRPCLLGIQETLTPLSIWVIGSKDNCDEGNKQEDRNGNDGESS